MYINPQSFCHLPSTNDKNLNSEIETHIQANVIMTVCPLPMIRISILRLKHKRLWGCLPTNDKNLNSEIETLMRTFLPLRRCLCATNDKNLNSEIETNAASLILHWVATTTNDKNLNSEIETLRREGGKGGSI